MRDILTAALRASLVTWVLCGIAYPLALIGLGQGLMPAQANGSLETSPDGAVIGSRLIGQAWTGPAWFHGRPSATTDTDPNDPTKTLPAPYNAASSGGSNSAPPAKIWPSASSPIARRWRRRNRNSPARRCRPTC